jgi:hypothetical protein
MNGREQGLFPRRILLAVYKARKNPNQQLQIRDENFQKFMKIRSILTLCLELFAKNLQRHPTHYVKQPKYQSVNKTTDLHVLGVFPKARQYSQHQMY